MTNKVAIYSCITAGYDTLVQPADCAPEGFDFLLLYPRGQKPGFDTGVWRLREFDCTIKDPVLLSRYPKLNPHVVLPDYEYSLWIDGNVSIASPDFYKTVQEKIESEVPYSGVRHFQRDCVWDEAYKCFRTGRITIFQYWNALIRLRFKGMPRHYGLCENNLIFRRHNAPEIIKMDSLWWNDLRRGACRDQIWMTPALRKCGIPFDYLLPQEYSVRNHPYFIYSTHKPQNA